jgi:hypothetical protein
VISGGIAFEPRAAVGVAVRTSGAIQDRAHDFQAAVDRGRTCAGGKPCFHERIQCLIVDLLRFELADMRLKQRNVPFDNVDAALTARLFDVTSGAIGEGWARVCLSREVAFDASHLCAESLLGLLLCYRADAQTDAYAEIPLIDESSSVGEDGDAGCACRGHELLLFDG